jgi:hypothetical protein
MPDRQNPLTTGVALVVSDILEAAPKLLRLLPAPFKKSRRSALPHLSDVMPS